MPFEAAQTATEFLPLAGAPDAAAEDRPAFFGETLPAAFRQENLLASSWAADVAPVYRTDVTGRPAEYLREPGFDPLTPEELQGYEAHADRFARVLTREQANAVRSNIDRETADRDTLARAGVPGMVAMMGAGLIDPTVLIPIGGQIKKGQSLLTSVSHLATAAAAGTAIQEAGLNASQELRTAEENAVNVGGAVFLGGILGGVAHPFLRTPAGAAAIASVGDDLQVPRAGDPDWADPMQALPADDPRPAGYYSSLGAAGRDRPTMDQQAIQGVMARTVAEGLRLQDPLMSSITSRSLVQRELIEQLADIPSGLSKNEASWQIRTLPDGREQRYLVWGARTEQSVESAIKRKDAMLGRAVTSMDDFYIRYLHGRERRSGDILGAGVRAVTGNLPAGRMSRPDFYREVTLAMRRGDVHDLPDVQQAAQHLRREYFDPLKAEARDLGLFGYERVRDPNTGELVERPREPDVSDTAESWIPRVYNREVIMARQAEFTNLLHRHFMRRRDEAAARAENPPVDARPGDVDLDTYRGDKSDGELLEDARRTVDHILGGPAGRLSFDGEGAIAPARGVDPGLSGRFKARVLDIQDVDIEDFLESDLEYLLRLTQRTMVPDIEFMRRFGSIDMDVQLKEVAEDFDRLIARAPDEAASRTLARKKKNALRDIEGVRDRLRGTYALPENPDGIWNRLSRTAISVNYLRLMGGVTLSSIPDMARAVVSHGIGNALGPMVRRLTGDLKTMRAMTQELQDAGPGFEMVLNNRAAAMADLMDDYGRGSKLERAISGAQSYFGYASLIAPWNQAMKQVAGFAVQNRVLRSVVEAQSGKISRGDATFLAQLGIGQDDALRMADQFRRHGATRGGQRMANSRDWSDAALRERWQNALRKEIDRLIVTPGQDKPLFTSGTLGRVIFQFRSYNFAATQRVLIAALQGLEAGDAHAIMALTTQVGLGMVTAKLKAEQYGLSTEDWTAGRWLAEGIDRGGILGVLTDVNMMAEHSTRGRIGLSALAGEGTLTRYQTRNALGAYLGPTAGTFQDVLQGGSALVSAGLGGGDELRRSDVAALRRLLPYQNLFWLRGAFDALEASAAETIGADE